MSWDSWRFICGAGWKVLEDLSRRVEVRMRKWDKRVRRARIVRSLRYVAGVSTGMTLDPQSTDSIQQIGVIPTIYPPLARQDPSNVISVDTEGATRSPQTEEYCSHAVGRGVFAASVEGAATCADAGVGQLCE